MSQDTKQMIAMLERTVMQHCDDFRSSIMVLNEKASNIPKLDAQQEFIKKDIERIYQALREEKKAYEEALVRIHARIDGSHTYIADEVSKLQEQFSNATTRIEEHLGEKVDVQAAGLNELKNDYEQKIASIKAVWYVGGLLMILLQGVGAFLVKSYVSNWQARIEIAEKDETENRKQVQQLEESIKELQNEAILEKSGK